MVVLFYACTKRHDNYFADVIILNVNKVKAVITVDYRKPHMV